LLECDQKILQEMGIKKVGDRVRIFIAIKQLRNKSGTTSRQKNMVRCGDIVLVVSFALC
jgi:mitogen-activated protein kinase kinase kinase